MISVKVSGGLGNQMFQYAIGRNLAEKNNTQLKLDITALLNSLPKKDFSFREFGLDVFQVKYKFNICSRLALATGLKNIFFIMNKVGLIFRNKIRPIIVEKGQFNFEEKVLDLKDELYLDGYWQNERYFLEISDIIRQEFLLKNSLDGWASNWQKQINSVNSVAIHIRRGDYVNLGLSEICGLDYYERAIELIKSKIENPEFFIFSDDPKWASDNFSGDNIHIVSSIENKSAAIEMYLMSACAHQIIANSSFSWWGAWLNKNINKIVIAPSKWTIGTENSPILTTWIKAHV
ncbi:MAG: alpha-1,2-fucosyltransferase [Candidatus Falkowbacteria bacterium]